MSSRSDRDRGWAADPRFHRFVQLFDERRFFEAHEVLEELWLATPEDDRDRPLIQGLIQLAVALEHRRRGNGAGASKVLRSASRRLAPFGASRSGVEIGDLRSRIERYLADPNGESAPPTFQRQPPGRKTRT